MSLLEIFLMVVVIGSLSAIAVILYYNRKNLSLDQNKDGKADLADLKIGINNAVKGAKSDITAALDLNKDGKLDAADVKLAVKKVNTPAVKKSLDLNKDGKLDAADVKLATKKAKDAIKKAKETSKPKSSKAKPDASKSKK